MYLSTVVLIGIVVRSRSPSLWSSQGKVALRAHAADCSVLERKTKRKTLTPEGGHEGECSTGGPHHC